MTNGPDEVAGGELKPFPDRLNSVPPRIANAQMLENEKQCDAIPAEKSEFRKTYKEANPDCKSVATVAKEGGEKWKSMTDEEKKIYLDRAAELKAEYDKALNSDKDVQNADDKEDGSLDKEAQVETVSDDE
ncbi:High mobility group B protein 7 [Camellia lanceoleosa]|uniref:High mobility group B protein 7 n=1 Tax=Camellia lanceoleosa TaxID=1840588 RepID=A0ACC0HNZ8_9ERIC|nr:High mobility group B protein 7 [Camellia lanceoleosa]